MTLLKTTFTQQAINKLALLPQSLILILLTLTLVACGGGGGGGGSSSSTNNTKNISPLVVSNIVATLDDADNPTAVSLSWNNPSGINNVSIGYFDDNEGIDLFAIADTLFTISTSGSTGSYNISIKSSASDTTGVIEAGLNYVFAVTPISDKQQILSKFSNPVFTNASVSALGVGSSTPGSVSLSWENPDNLARVQITTEYFDTDVCGGEAMTSVLIEDGSTSHDIDGIRADLSYRFIITPIFTTDNQPGIAMTTSTFPATDLTNDCDGVDDDADVDDDGDGLIEIRSAAQLNMLRNNLEGTALTATDGATGNSTGCGGGRTGNSPTGVCTGYELVDNIDLNELVSGATTGANWDSIGSCLNTGCSSVTAFDAEFNGNGYNISNMRINIDANAGGVGFFGAVAANNVISNVHLLNASIQVAASTTANNVGGLVGFGQDINITSASATILELVGNNNVGVLIGNAVNSRITSSYVIATTLSANVGVGGFIGEGRNVIITSSYALLGNITGSQEVGGFIGNGTEAKISSSYAISSFVIPSNPIAHFAALSGSATNAEIETSYAVTNNITIQFAGGFVGGLFGGSSSNLPNSIMDSFWDNTRLIFLPGDAIAGNSRRQEDINQGRTTSQLQSTTQADGSFPEIYSSWANAYCNPATGAYQESDDTATITRLMNEGFFRAWDLGTASEYPASTCTPTFTPTQQRAAMTRILAGESPIIP